MVSGAFSGSSIPKKKTNKYKHSFFPADLAEDILDESSISENENEWVPSSWDSLAKPVRSALKSPDKSSSVSTKF